MAGKRTSTKAAADPAETPEPTTRPEPAPGGGTAPAENTGGGDDNTRSAPGTEGDGGDEGDEGENTGGGGDAAATTTRMFSPEGSPAAPLKAPPVLPARREHQITSPAVMAVMGEDHRRIVDDEGNEITDLSAAIVKEAPTGSVRVARKRIWAESSVPGAPNAAPRRRLLYGEGAPVPEYEYERQQAALARATGE